MKELFHGLGVGVWKVQLAVKPLPVAEPPKPMGLEGRTE